MLACITAGDRCVSRIASAKQWRRLDKEPLATRSLSTSPIHNRNHKTIRPNTLGPRRKWVNLQTKKTPEERLKSTPSLAKQLLPAGFISPTGIVRAQREIPRLPLDLSDDGALGDLGSAMSQIESEVVRSDLKSETITPASIPALWIENASRHLTIEDFRRLIPRGKHIQGWKLEKGDIIKCFPSRFLQDLSQKSWYYLIFSSHESALAYKSYVERIHRLAKRYSAGTIPSLSLLPSHHDLDEEALASVLPNYALLSPDQELALRIVGDPMSRYTEHLLKHNGLQIVNERPDKMPYELRMTLIGPQYSIARLRRIFAASSADRDLNWSGTYDTQMRISKWESTTLSLEEWTKNQTLPKVRPAKFRRPDRVYIIGFETEFAAQSFMYYWHNRAVVHEASQESGIGDDEEKELDVPPVAKIELLW